MKCSVLDWPKHFIFFFFFLNFFKKKQNLFKLVQAEPTFLKKCFGLAAACEWFSLP